MNCFRAVSSAARLSDRLLSAAKAAATGKMVKEKSLLADAALDAADLSKSGPTNVRRAAIRLSTKVFSLVNSPGAGVSVQKVMELRGKAKLLGAMSMLACRSRITPR